MKKFILMMLAVASMLFQPHAIKTSAEVYARSYIVMEQNSGKVLEGKDIHLTRSVASISKIMTAIIAIESDKLFEVVTIGEEIKEAVGSSLYLEKGTQITVIDLVYGLLLRSGNDAAMAIAVRVGGTVEHFVEKMNEKADQLGMKNTVFRNPHGLDMDDEGNTSSTYDMALLMQYCLENDLFRDISSSKSYLNKQKGLWVNKHKLIQNYEWATGGKTGYTTKAKRTLITAAKKDELELIVVTFDCGGDFSLHRSLFEKYFSEYVGIVYLEKGKNTIHDFAVIVPKRIILMIAKKDVAGGIMIYQINIDNNILTMTFIKKDKTIMEVGKLKVTSFASSGKRVLA